MSYHVRHAAVVLLLAIVFGWLAAVGGSSSEMPPIDPLSINATFTAR